MQCQCSAVVKVGWFFARRHCSGLETSGPDGPITARRALWLNEWWDQTHPVQDEADDPGCARPEEAHIQARKRQDLRMNRFSKDDAALAATVFWELEEALLAAGVDAVVASKFGRFSRHVTKRISR